MTINATRRDVIKGAGALAVSFDLVADAARAADAPGQKLPGDLATSPKVSSWLRVEAGGKIRLLVGKVELGQGVLTAVAQLCADELDVDLARVAITSGDTRLVPDEGVTAGSFSMPNCGSAVRQVSAEARQILLGLAAKQLGVARDALTVADGTVKAPDGKSTTYWDIVANDAFEVQATGAAPLKPRDARRYAGRHVPRLDIPFKVTGTNIFIQDFRPEGMLHGRVLRPPAYDAKLVSLDTTSVEKTAGVVKVVRDGSFVGVIAEREENAIKARQALTLAARWSGGSEMPDPERLFDYLTALPSVGKVVNEKKGAAATNARAIEAVYTKPYGEHGSIGPSCALAEFKDSKMTVWSHTQGVFPLRLDLSKA